MIFLLTFEVSFLLPNKLEAADATTKPTAIPPATIELGSTPSHNVYFLLDVTICFKSHNSHCPGLKGSQQCWSAHWLDHRVSIYRAPRVVYFFNLKWWGSWSGQGGLIVLVGIRCVHYIEQKDWTAGLHASGILYERFPIKKLIRYWRQLHWPDCVH